MQPRPIADTGEAGRPDLPFAEVFHRIGCATKKEPAKKQNGRLDLRRAARFVFL
jgi:hypothetical protein